MKIWVENAPTIGIDSEDKIKEFIRRHITCSIPTATESPILHNLVETFQVHKCSKSCLRTIKLQGKEGKKFITKCRYGYPRKVCTDIEINTLDETVKSRKSKKNIKIYSCPRTKDESNINDYNPAILTAWGANIDLQVIVLHFPIN
jgi:hypothetical protein